MESPNKQHAVVIGSGSWGTALACLLSHHFEKVTLIARKDAVVQDINTNHKNSAFLPKATLKENIVATTDYAMAKSADIIVVVVPTSAVRETSKKLATYGVPDTTPIVSCAKGIERGTGIRMSEIISLFFPDNPIAVLSGPNHAEEVSVGLATCAVVATDRTHLLPYLQEIFTVNYFRTYTSHDIPGIELGGALKNVFAMASGIAFGFGLGDNAIAALVTRGLTEMTRLGTALGGKEETFQGLSGIGDLMATCYSQHSRNNRVGNAIGKGASLEEATELIGMVAEGVPNTLSAYEQARTVNVDTPIIDSVYAILYEKQPIREVLDRLFARDLKGE